MRVTRRNQLATLHGSRPHARPSKQTRRGGAWGAGINTLKHANHLKLNGTQSSRFFQNNFKRQLGGCERTASSPTRGDSKVDLDKRRKKQQIFHQEENPPPHSFPFPMFSFKSGEWLPLAHFLPSYRPPAAPSLSPLHTLSISLRPGAPRLRCALAFPLR